MQRGRQSFRLEASQHLDYPDQTRRCFQVSDVRFHRSELQSPTILRSRLAIHRVQRLDFNRIPQRCSRSVAFDDIYVGRIHREVKGQNLLWGLDSKPDSMVAFSFSIRPH